MAKENQPPFDNASGIVNLDDRRISLRTPARIVFDSTQERNSGEELTPSFATYFLAALRDYPILLAAFLEQATGEELIKLDEDLPPLQVIGMPPWKQSSD
jgi:hypothetical protein